VRWTEYCYWVAVVQWVDATTNRTIVSGCLWWRDHWIGETSEGGPHLLVILGSELSNETKKERGQCGLKFDGFRWIGGCNNLPKINLIIRIQLGEMACRVMMMGE
jgi:hypothetical protein